MTEMDECDIYYKYPIDRCYSPEPKLSHRRQRIGLHKEYKSKNNTHYVAKHGR